MVFIVTALLALLTIASAFFLIQGTRERQKVVLENKRLAQAIDSASDGIVMTDPNLPDNPIIYANKTFFNLTGYLFEKFVEPGSLWKWDCIKA